MAYNHLLSQLYSNMFIAINNKDRFFTVRKSGYIRSLLAFLTSRRYIENYVLTKNGFFYQVELRYSNHRPLIKDIQLHSRISSRNYLTLKKMFVKVSKYNARIFILSTDYGLMTLTEAFHLKLGGEIIFSFVV